MPHPRPRVSAIIPVHDREEWIAAAVDSALAQEGVACEVIVVDDGSTDGTPDVLAGYGDRIVRVRQANAGCAAARNAGLARARGELLAWLDSDDAWLPGKLRTQAAFHAAHPELAGSAHGIRRVEADGAERDLPPSHDPVALRERPLEVLLDHFSFYPSAVMARSDLTRRIGGFRAEFLAAEDLDYVLRLARMAPLGVLPDCLVRKHEHPGRTSRRQRALMNARVLRRHLEELELSPEDAARLRRRIARYTLSVAKRARDAEERRALLAEARRIDPAVRRRASYLRLRWRSGLGRA